MDFKQKIFAVVSSILIVLIIDHFFIHYLFPMKKANFIKERSQEVQESLQAHPPTDENEPLLPKKTTTELTDFKTASQECLGGTWTSHATIARELEKTYGVQSKNVDIENFHLKNADGDERRIHIVQESPGKKQVRYFSVDAEDLPVPIPLTEEQRKMEPDQLIAQLKAIGPVFFHQTKERWLLGNGASFQATFENDEVREFQIFGPSKTLSCLENSCQCL